MKKIGGKGSDDRFDRFFNLYYFFTYVNDRIRILNYEILSFYFEDFILESIIKFWFNLNVKDIYLIIYTILGIFNLYVSFKIFKVEEKILPIFRIIMF